MKTLTSMFALLSITLPARLAYAEGATTFPIFVHYTHDAVDAHLNLACDLGRVSSFSAPYAEHENPSLAPSWEIFVKPVAFAKDEVEVEAKVFEFGKPVLAPQIKLSLGESATVTMTDANGRSMNLEIKTQRDEGLAPVKSWHYKPHHISFTDAISYTAIISDPMEKSDLRTRVSYDDNIEFVGTEYFLSLIRRRLAEVDVARTSGTR